MQPEIEIYSLKHLDFDAPMYVSLWLWGYFSKCQTIFSCVFRKTTTMTTLDAECYYISTKHFQRKTEIQENSVFLGEIVQKKRRCWQQRTLNIFSKLWSDFFFFYTKCALRGRTWCKKLMFLYFGCNTTNILTQKVEPYVGPYESEGWYGSEGWTLWNRRLNLMQQKIE